MAKQVLAIPPKMKRGTQIVTMLRWDWQLSDEVIATLLEKQIAWQVQPEKTKEDLLVAFAGYDKQGTVKTVEVHSSTGTAEVLPGSDPSFPVFFTGKEGATVLHVFLSVREALCHYTIQSLAFVDWLMSNHKCCVPEESVALAVRSIKSQYPSITQTVIHVPRTQEGGNTFVKLRKELGDCAVKVSMNSPPVSATWEEYLNVWRYHILNMEAVETTSYPDGTQETGFEGRLLTLSTPGDVQKCESFHDKRHYYNAISQAIISGRPVIAETPEQVREVKKLIGELTPKIITPNFSKERKPMAVPINIGGRQPHTMTGMGANSTPDPASGWSKVSNMIATQPAYAGPPKNLPGTSGQKSGVAQAGTPQGSPPEQKADGKPKLRVSPTGKYPVAEIKAFGKENAEFRNALRKGGN